MAKNKVPFDKKVEIGNTTALFVLFAVKTACGDLSVIGYVAGKMISYLILSSIAYLIYSSFENVITNIKGEKAVQ